MPVCNNGTHVCAGHTSRSDDRLARYGMNICDDEVAAATGTCTRPVRATWPTVNQHRRLSCESIALRPRCIDGLLLGIQHWGALLLWQIPEACGYERKWMSRIVNRVSFKTIFYFHTLTCNDSNRWQWPPPCSHMFFDWQCPAWRRLTRPFPMHPHNIATLNRHWNHALIDGTPGRPYYNYRTWNINRPICASAIQLSHSCRPQHFVLCSRPVYWWRTTAWWRSVETDWHLFYSTPPHWVRLSGVPRTGSTIEWCSLEWNALDCQYHWLSAMCHVVRPHQSRRPIHSDSRPEMTDFRSSARNLSAANDRN